MRFRKFGNLPFQVSEIGFGGWGIGGVQWLGGDDTESLSALRVAIESGLNFIDTALAYGDGHSERLIGRFLADMSSTVLVATKVPPKNRVWPADSGIGIHEVFPYKYIMESCEHSLTNLQRERIDLLQLHVWNPEWTGCDEWKRAFEDLKSSGKVAAVGISLTEHEPDSGLDAVSTGLIDAVQVIYNIFDQSPEQNLLPACAANRVGVVVRVPLDEGSLTGTITEQTQFDPADFRAFYFRGDRRKQVGEHVGALKDSFADYDGSLAELALRFCLSHPAVSTVIPGMRRSAHVAANCGASSKGPLEPGQLAMLRKHAWQRSFYQ
jgi:aryl-alcohol dehydrogenase-like predicted oxidoreductase